MALSCCLACHYPTLETAREPFPPLVRRDSCLSRLRRRGPCRRAARYRLAVRIFAHRFPSAASSGGSILRIASANRANHYVTERVGVANRTVACRHVRESDLRGAAADWRKSPRQVEWLDEIEGGPEYRIKKLRYEALPGLWVPALLYEPLKLTGKVPVIMNVNGHDRADGKAAKYKQIRCINQAKRGMIALNVEWLGMGQLSGDGFVLYRMNQLDLCGTSGIAPFYLTMERGLDVLLDHEHADPTRVGVAGLSGGGWQTIFISSLDTRVTLTNPVAGYSSFVTRVHNHSDLGDSERHGNRRRLQTSDSHDGSTGHVADIQCRRQLLFRVGSRPAAVSRCSRTRIPTVRQNRAACFACES